jgi:hypothetical protein
MSPDRAALLRRLALSDPDALRGAVGGTAASDFPLDQRTVAAVRLAALAGLGAASASYVGAVTDALALGISEVRVVGVLSAIATEVGRERLAAAADQLALALGYDLQDGAGV